MKASDISDVAMCEAIDKVIATKNQYVAFIWDLQEAFPEFPQKVILAKLRRLEHRKLIEGCTCGCRGDFRTVKQT